MRDVIRVGIIGYGSVADKYIPQLHSLNYPRPRVEIAMTCDHRPEPPRFDAAPVLGAGGHLVHDAGRTT